MITISIPGEPVAQGRARAFAFQAGGRTQIRMYDPAKSRSWKATAQQFMRDAMVGLPTMTGPVRLTVRAYFTCPKTDCRKTQPRPQRWHTKKPDGDNVLKAVKDAAKGVLWLDDCQVCSATVEKFIAAQGEAPQIEIVVELLEAPASKDSEAA